MTTGPEAEPAEAQWEISRELYRSVADALPVGLYRLDANGKILFANAFMCRYLLGREPAECLGRSIYDFERARADTPRPDAELSSREADLETMASGKIQTRVEDYPGVPGYAAYSLEVTRIPVRDADGSVIGIQGIIRDISAQRLADERQRLASLVFEASHQAIVVMDHEWTVLEVNAAFVRITGYAREEVIGRDPSFMRAENQAPEDYAAMRQGVAEQSHWAGEFWGKRKSGELFPQAVTAEAMRDESGRITNLIYLFHDISEQKRRDQHIQYLAQYDALTDLPNRTLLRDRMGVAMEVARRNGTAVAVLFVDLDRFKNINDSLGHHYGDQLLKGVARRLTDAVRAADTVCRYGGDEFIVMLSDIAAESDVRLLALKLLQEMAQPYLLDQREFVLTTSIGISLYPADGDDIDTLLRNADTAMYVAKDAGRNRYRLYSAEMNVQVSHRFELERELRLALARNEFFLTYQPQVDLDSRCILGAEALIRWQHPRRGVVAPAEFIPIAEDSGLILDIGEWVMEAACRQYAEWLDAGLSPGRLSVNVSGHQFRQARFVDRIVECLARTGLDASRLELEVTESVIMEGTDLVLEKLNRLAELGVSLAIDDFGTGYSSLSYLKLFKIDRLKVDRSFVRGLPHDNGDDAITHAILSLGRNLKLSVLAEGIETAEQLECLRSAGCTAGQGYLFSKPLEAADYKDLLRQSEAPVARFPK